MNDAVHAWYLNQQEPVKSCLLTLRDLILAQDEQVTETQKYGMPCFCFKHKVFCYLWIDKKTREPYLLLVEGRHLAHPALETGNRSRMKILRIDPAKDLPVKTINRILKAALALYRSGVVKIKS